MRTIRSFIAVALLFALVGCGPVTFTVGSRAGDAEIDQTIVEEDSGAGGARIAMIDVSGLIFNGRSRGLFNEGDHPVGALHEKLRAAADDDRIKAVIVRLNTPGGTVTASDAMYREVMRFKKQTGKPVVALMMDVAASGGYYLACGADEIVAYPTTVTGSIGVIAQTVSFKPLMDRWGIKAEAFTSGPNKAAGSPLGEMTDGHRAVFRRMIDDFYGRFRELVRTSRPNIPADRFDTVTDGRVLTGTDALEVGLVDQLGDVYDAWAVAKKRAGVSRAHLVQLHRAGHTVRSAYATAPSPPTAGGVQINMAQINIATQGAGATDTFLYLWRPAGP